MRYSRPDWRKRREQARRRWNRDTRTSTAPKPLPEGCTVSGEQVVDVQGPPPGCPRAFRIQFIAPPPPPGFATYAEYRKAQDAEAKKSAEFHSNRVRAREGRAERPSEVSEPDDGWITVEVDEDASQANVEPRDLIL